MADIFVSYPVILLGIAEFDSDGLAECPPAGQADLFEVISPEEALSSFGNSGSV